MDLSIVFGAFWSKLMSNTINNNMTYCAIQVVPKVWATVLMS